MITSHTWASLPQLISFSSYSIHVNCCCPILCSLSNRNINKNWIPLHTHINTCLYVCMYVCTQWRTTVCFYSVCGEPSMFNIQTSVYTPICPSKQVYTYTFCISILHSLCDTHLKIVTSLALDLERRLSYPFLRSVSCCPTCIPMCACSWIDNKPK